MKGENTKQWKRKLWALDSFFIHTTSFCNTGFFQIHGQRSESDLEAFAFQKQAPLTPFLDLDTSLKILSCHDLRLDMLNTA